MPDLAFLLWTFLVGRKGSIPSIFLHMLTILIVCLMSQRSGFAQIVPDDTLPSPSTVPNGAESGTLSNVLIEGGTQNNSILFHSFEQFNVNSTQQVRFRNSATIDAIFSRVTGGLPSNINGQLRVDGVADLFFLNPNGVIFGPDARLDLNGAFVVSTAESFIFPDGSLFSAVNPSAPPLFTLNVPIGLQFGANPQPITVDGASLKLRPGNPLALLGGDILIDEGDFKTPGGRLVLGGLASPGILTLDLNAIASEDILAMPANAERVDVTMNNTNVFTQFEGNGDISIYGQDVTLTASRIESGIQENSGSSGSQAGNILLNATGDVQISQDSRVINEVRDNALGDGGNITIRADNLAVSDSSKLSTETASAGRAGNILIDIENLILVEGDEQQDSITLISSFSKDGESGATGNVTLTAQEIVLEGDVRVEINHDGSVSGGDITLESESFQLLAGASVNSVANGTAAAGDVNLQASTIILDDRGSSIDDSGSAGIDSTVGPGGENATGGTVNITTDNLTVIGVRIGATVQGMGQGGQVVINASDTVTLTTDETSGVSSIASAIRESGSGVGGDIVIEARRLIVENGSVIDAGVDGSGTSGTITLAIEEDIILQGRLSNGQPSSILTQLNRDVTGVGSDITISTAKLSLADGAQISAATRGNGPGGVVTIQASESIILTGSTPQVTLSDETDANFIANNGSFASGIFADSPGVGDAGDIEIVTPELVVQDRAQISVSSANEGSSGNIEVTADNIVLDGGVLRADAIAGADANITLNVQEALTLRNGSQVSTNARGTVSGGNITIANPTIVLLRDQSSITAENPGGTGNGGNISIETDFFIAAPEGLNRIIASADRGNGGNINIVTNSLLGRAFQDFSASSRFGVDGDIEIDSPHLDPTRGITALPSRLVDASNQIANACAIDRENQAKFVVTGRGGLSVTPASQPTGINPLPDLGTPVSTQVNQTHTALQEAHSWSVAANGDILLTADPAGGSLSHSLDPLLQTAAHAYYQADYGQAINLWTQVINSLPQDSAPLGQATIFSNLALASAQLGQWQQADAAIIASQQLLTPENTSAQVLAQILNTRASLHLSRGNPQTALDDWQQAADAYQQAGDIMGYWQTQLNQAQTLQSLGLYRQAETILTTIITHLADQPPSLLKATTLLTHGHGLRNSGKTAQAQQTLETAMAMAQTLNQPTLISPILLNLGHVTQTDAEQAFAHYQEALEIAPTSLGQWQAAISQLQLLATQNPEAAQHLWTDLQPALSQANFPSNRDAVYTQLHLIHTLLHHGLVSSSSENFMALLNHTNQQALSLQDTFAQTYILGYQGDFYRQQQQWSKAEEFTQKAFQQAHTLQTPEVVYPLAIQLGRLQKDQGKRAEAIAAYGAAIDALEILRKDLISTSDDVQFTFRDDVEPIYREFVKLLLQNDHDRVPTKDELRRARELIEKLQVAEINDYFQDDCIQGTPAFADEIDPSAAVIYPILLDGQLDVIVSVGDDIQHYSQPVAPQEITKTVQQLLGELKSPHKARRPYTIRRLQTLYDWILAPAENYLAQQGVKSLVFVADGVLRTLPLSALHDGEQYLIETYNVILSPGLSLMDPHPLPQQGLQMLAGGVSEARPGFAPLPFVRDELQQVTAQMPNHQILFNQALTTSNLVDSLKTTPASVVHLATHGEFGPSADDTFILTWDGKLTMEEMSQVLQARNLSDLSPVELLVFSACKTASGDSRAVLGIAGTAIRSGVRSTLAGLWAIDDQAAATFMTEFYKALAQPGTTKAEAFRQAQLALIANPRLSSPYYWSPFVLVGNWL